MKFLQENKHLFHYFELVGRIYLSKLSAKSAIHVHLRDFFSKRCTLIFQYLKYHLHGIIFFSDVCHLCKKWIKAYFKVKLTSVVLDIYWAKVLPEQCIMITCPCNVHPLTSHFYIQKLGFTGVFIIFLFLLLNIDCGYSLEPPP